MNKKAGWVPPEQYYAALPKKAMAAGILLFNDLGLVLLVKPSYREHWEFPGGVIDQNESPRAAALRETKEEIGLTLENIRLVCVQYRPSQTSVSLETLQFTFYGGVLTPNKIEQIVLESSELEEFRFVSEEEASPLLNDVLRKRLHVSLEAIKSGTTAYLET